MSKALALQRLGAAEIASPIGLETGLMIARNRKGTTEDGACPQDTEDFDEPAAADDSTAFDDCDILSVRMVNAGKKPIDVTVLLIGQDFSITPVWPTDGADNRIHLGETKIAPILQMELDPKSASQERLVFIATPGVSKSHTAFDNLEQEGLRAAPGDDETPGLAAVRDLLAAGLTEMSRATATAARQAGRRDVGGGEAVLRRQGRGRPMTRACQIIGFRSSGTPRVPHADPVVKGDRSGMGRAVGTGGSPRHIHRNNQ